MTSFVVHGPFELGYAKRNGGRVLEFDTFWSDESEASYLREKCGCYIFAIRNRALIPLYVGKATKSFKAETFNPGNKHKYHDGFTKYGIGTPVMYFVVHPDQKGPTNARQISEIESFLIATGAAKNPEIQDIKGAQQPDWKIKGVVRGGAGKRSSAETDFRKLFDIHD